MPNAVMKKIIGIGSLEDKKQLLKQLTKFGCIEVISGGEKESEDISITKAIDEANLKLSKIAFAKKFVKDEKIVIKQEIKAKHFTKEKKKELSLSLKPKPEIDFEKFSNTKEYESSTFDKIADIENYSSKILAIKAEKAKILARKEQLKAYSATDIIISKFKDTKYTKAILGVISVDKNETFNQILISMPNVIAKTYSDENSTILAMICLNEEYDELVSKLSEIDFTECNISSDKKIVDEIDDLYSRLSELDIERSNIAKEVNDKYCNDEFTLELGLIEDFYNVELQKLQAEQGMVNTKSTFMFEAWYPTGAEELITSKLENSKMTLYFITRDAIEGEEPPTLALNNSLVTPYNSVTLMFNCPSYSELNPNPFVAFFFILFFGVMISDAGYGLLMTLGTAIYLAIKKPRKNEMALVKIICAGGISTIFWGILFGSYFGISADEFGMWYWFSPIYDPITMLALSLGLGLLQMLTGMAINAYQLFKRKQPLDAIFGVFSWYALLIGLAMFVLGGSIAGVKYTGIALLVLGLVGLAIAGALHKKGIGKLSGAFGNLYGIINFFSDLLSYTRLFGLGIATGVIALVFNQIAMVMVNMNVYIGSVVAIFILVGGHLFNIGINTLGAYVHNSRLQFVEFFGRFYEGGGHYFNPLGSTMKNYNFVLDSEDVSYLDQPKKKEKKQIK